MFFFSSVVWQSEYSSSSCSSLWSIAIVSTIEFVLNLKGLKKRKWGRQTNKKFESSNIPLKHINIMYCRESRCWKFCIHKSNFGFFIKKNSKIFTFSILVCTWNNNFLYYTLPETLAFVKLFVAIEGDVYRNILKQMCLVFIYDPSQVPSPIRKHSIFCCFSKGEIL